MTPAFARSGRSGFTLIEIIIVLVIMAVITGTAVLSVGRGLKDARARDAARVVQQYVRHAKAVALLKGRPTVLNIEEISEGGEFLKSRISITYSAEGAAGDAATITMAGGQTTGAGAVRTISGKAVTDDGVSEEQAALTQAAQPSASDEMQDPLHAEPREFEGIHVRAALRENEEVNRPRISVFSNVDYLKRRSEEAKTREKEKKEDENRDASAQAEDEDGESVDEEASFSVVYEANGRCEPYKVKVWRDGGSEDDAIEFSIGRFGRPVTKDD